MTSAASTLASKSPLQPAAGAESGRGADVGAHAGFGLTDVGLILMAVIWGVNFSVVKVGLRAIDPLPFAALRVLLAAVVLIALAALTRGATLPPRRDIVALAGLGIIGNGIYQLLFIAGLQHTSAGIAALLIAAGPAWIAVMSRLMGREQLPARGWIGIGLQMIGVACVVGSAGSGGTGSGALLGAALIAAGSATWATFTVLLQPYSVRVHPFQLSAITMVSGAIVCLVVAVPGLLHTQWSTVGIGAWGALVYASIGSMVLAYLLYYHGIRMLGATRTAVYGNLQPLVALAVAALVLGERPTGWQLLGAAFIMAGLLMSRTTRVKAVASTTSHADRS
jgi:drug/metabolite transporter (DMT)-like permease